MSKKIVSPSKKRTCIPKVEDFETTELNHKFQELERLRKEVEIKKAGATSVEFLTLVRKEHQIKVSGLDKQIAELKAEMVTLKKIKSKALAEEKVVEKELSRLGEFSMFEGEIEGLRKKVQEKNEQIKSKRS